MGVLVNPPQRRVWLLITVLLVLLTAVVFLLLYYFKPKGLDLPFVGGGKSKSQNTQIALTPSPSPKPIPTGRQVYRFSHGKNVTGPKLQTVLIEPLDPKTGEKQVVTAVIAHNQPMTQASLTLQTDNQIQTYPLRLVAGDNLNGTFRAEIEVSDTYDYIYYFKFDLKSAVDSYEGGLRIR